MDEREMSGIIEFFSHVQRLKALKRAGWVRHKVPDPESVASHMYGVALLSLILSEGKGLDNERMLKLALVHDLVEASTGDLTPKDKKFKQKRTLEERALPKIVAGLPATLRKEILELDHEYASRKSPEARIVSMASVLDMVLTATEYEKGGFDLHEFFDVDDSDFTEIGKGLIKYLKRLGNSE
jgi:putative hydrolase of HD superfamily